MIKSVVIIGASRGIGLGFARAYADDDIVFHELFPISSYSAAIPDPELRATFNATLHAFIDDGRYQKLLDKYKLDNLLYKLPTPVTQ